MPYTKNHLTLMEVMNQLKALNRLQPAKGKSHLEMCFKDIRADCHVRNDRMQPSHSLHLKTAFTLAERFGFNSFPALLQSHSKYMLTGSSAKGEEKIVVDLMGQLIQNWRKMLCLYSKKKKEEMRI